MTVKMIRIDDRFEADIHPDEVDGMRKHGWRLADAREVQTDTKVAPAVDIEKLREDAKALGLKPHWKASAETIQAAIDAKLAE